MASTRTTSAVLIASIFLFCGVFHPVLANDKLLARLEKLNAEIAANSEVADESGPVVEALKRKLASEAKKIRATKQLADEVEVNEDILALGEESMVEIRDRLAGSASELKNIKEIIDSLESILEKNKAAIQEHAEDAAKIRQAIDDSGDGAELTKLQNELERAKALIASQSATIRKLQSREPTGTSTVAAVEKAVETTTATPLRLDDAFARLQAGEIDEAEAAFKKMQVNPATVDDATIGLASCAFARGEMSRARELLDPVLEDNQENPRALGLHGALLCDAGKFKDARNALEAAVELDGLNPYYLNYLGVALRGLKKNKEAVAAIQKAVELDPYYLAARFNLVLILASARRPDLETARLHYEQYIALGGASNAYIEGLLAAAESGEAGEEQP